jgi:arylsulfatase A-like enzyme
MSHLNRRDFLKLAGFTSSAMLLPKMVHWADSTVQGSLPANIIILVFDAMSARNLSVYGYPRQTTPNLERFASHANVYHAHSSGGNFTTPGTASLLTGTYPWTHRAINFRGVVQPDMVDNNLFALLGDQYTRLAFPQNFWATFLLSQFEAHLDVLLSSGSFSELNFLVSDYFPNDRNLAARALDDFVFKLYGIGGQTGKSGTLFLGSLESWLYAEKRHRLSNDGYPEQIPYVDDYPINFRLENVFEGLKSVFTDLRSPFLTYLHLLPPHAPYVPTNQFANQFKDNIQFPEKPEHRLSDGYPKKEMRRARQQYDEYIASTDHEFGRFLDFLEKSKLLENSYVIITSDHGEMFERGEIAHATPLLYDPVIHIPLLISAPGQTTRHDIYTPTNAVDILPTLAKISGKPIPDYAEGAVLPGFTDEADDIERSIFTVEAKTNRASSALQHASISLRKGNRKIIYYTGYKEEDAFELYDLEEDLEEMRDLYVEKPAFATRMKDELLETLFESNKPYMK